MFRRICGAVACYHDGNGNGKLDTNMLGIVKEGMGASRDAKGSMGPPKFDNAKVEMERDTARGVGDVLHLRKKLHGQLNGLKINTLILACKNGGTNLLKFN